MEINNNINLYTYVLTTHAPIYYNLIKSNDFINIKNCNENISEGGIDKLFPPFEPDIFMMRSLFLICKKNNNNIVLDTQIPFIYGNKNESYDLISGTIFANNTSKQKSREKIFEKIKQNNKIDVKILIQILFNISIKNDDDIVKYYEENKQKIDDLYYSHITYSELDFLINYITNTHHVLKLDISLLNFYYYVNRKYVVTISVIANDINPPDNLKYNIYNSIEDFFLVRDINKEYELIINDKYVLVQSLNSYSYSNNDEYIDDNEIEVNYEKNKKYELELKKQYEIELDKNINKIFRR